MRTEWGGGGGYTCIALHPLPLPSRLLPLLPSSPYLLQNTILPHCRRKLHILEIMRCCV